MPEKPQENEAGCGEESIAELFISNNLAKVIHLFLSALVVLLLVAAAIATFDINVRRFTMLWQPQTQYAVL